MTYFSEPDFAENRFPILKKIVLWFFRDFFAILKKIVFWFIRKSFLIFSRFYSDFEENRFLIFSWFLETRFIKLICIRKNTEKIVCKSRDFNTILSTIYSSNFLVWVHTEPLLIVSQSEVIHTAYHVAVIHVHADYVISIRTNYSQVTCSIKLTFPIMLYIFIYWT